MKRKQLIELKKKIINLFYYRDKPNDNISGVGIVLNRESAGIIIKIQQCVKKRAWIVVKVSKCCILKTIKICTRTFQRLDEEIDKFQSNEGQILN